MYFELPQNGTITPSDVLFTIPNEMTEGVFINLWLVALYGLLTIGSTRYNQSIQAGSMFAAYGTFIITFLLVLLSSFTNVPIAGGNQLIAAAVILVANMLWNYMTRGGPV